MARSTNERLISFAFTLLSVIGVWRLNLSELFGDAAIRVGISQDTTLFEVVQTGGIPTALMAVAGLAIWFYNKVLWPLWPYSGCRRGWWVYGLKSQLPNGDIRNIVGRFRLAHTPGEASISQGRAFALGEIEPIFRGNWTSDVVWISATEIRAIFEMRAINPRPEAMPSVYNGYISLARAERSPLTGRACWEGEFHDLGDRRNASGWIYAERLHPNLTSGSDKADAVLKQYAEQLVQRTPPSSL